MDSVAETGPSLSLQHLSSWGGGSKKRLLSKAPQGAYPSDTALQGPSALLERVTTPPPVLPSFPGLLWCGCQAGYTPLLREEYTVPFSTEGVLGFSVTGRPRHVFSSFPPFCAGGEIDKPLVAGFVVF